MDFTLVLAAAAAVNRFVEFAKVYVDKLGFTDSVRDGVLVLIAVLSGILIALLSGGAVNLFTSVPTLTPLAGQILTGVLAGLGADVLNAVIGLLYGWRDNTDAKAAEHAAKAEFVTSP
jgi:hypothetical protein